MKSFLRSRELKAVSTAIKPNPVPDYSYLQTGNDHSSSDDSYPSSLATYPGAWTGRPQTLPYLVLHRVGFTKLSRSPGKLVRSYRTVSPLPNITNSPKTASNTRRSALCCTFLHVAMTPCYGAPCPLVFGLSSGINRRSFQLHQPLIAAYINVFLKF